MNIYKFLKFSALLVLMLLGSKCFPQHLAYESHFNGTSSNWAFVNDHTVDSDGNLILVGHFTRTITLGDSTITIDFNGDNGYVAKISSDGKLIWYRIIQSGESNDAVSRIVKVDDKGNILVLSEFEGLVFPEQNNNTLFYFTEDQNILASFYTSDGTYQKSYNLRASGVDLFPNDGVLEPDGGILITGGLIIDDADRDSDLFLIHLDSEGNLDMSYSVPSPENYESALEVIFVDDHYYISGRFGSPTDFDISSEELIIQPGAGIDVFVWKLNKNFETIWVYHTEGSDDNGINSVTNMVVDGNGDLMIKGGFYESVNFDPGKSNISLTTDEEFEVGFFLKLNSSGELLWVKEWDKDISDMVVDKNNEILAFSSKDDNIYIDKISSDGEYIWQQLIPTNTITYKFSEAITLSAENKISISLEFDGELFHKLDAQSSLVSSTFSNFVILNYSENQATPFEFVPAEMDFQVYPNLVVDEYHIENHAGQLRLDLLDISGKILYSKNIPEGRTTLEIPDHAGNYFIRLRAKNSDQVRTIKLQKI